MKRLNHILAVLLVVGLAVGCRLTPSLTASAQIGTWVAEGSGRDHFKLSEIQDLPAWTSLYVFAPYTPTSMIRQKLGFEWRDAKRFSLDTRDDIHLAVFISGTNVARVEEWGRGQFDCSSVLTGHALLASTVIHIDRTKAVPTLTIAEPDHLSQQPPRDSVR